MAEALEEAPEDIPDRRLALMFACAHPALEPGVRAPLILQTLLKLTASDIAQAFLVPPKAMGQRLVRAKTRIRETGIPLAVPGQEELPARLDAVLEAIYAAYGKAWGELGADESASLAGETLWLAQLTVSLLPQAPEAQGLLALMLYTESRRAARRGPDGAYVPLAEQDTTLWDHHLIAQAEALLREASAGGPSGRFQIEAAIQSAHVAAARSGVSQAAAVVALYDHLIQLTGSPVAALNRAAALAELQGPQAALAALDCLEDIPCLKGYQPWWATRGHVLALAGRVEEAREALTIAMGLTTDEAMRVYLRRRLERLSSLT
jgi:RNA polymerase sigma-70 factor (ECF subfamily)